MDNINKNNYIKEANSAIELNFLEQLSEHRYFKKIFEIKMIKKLCEMPLIKKVFDHKLARKIMNREMLMYLIFGVLATIVNFVAYAIFADGLVLEKVLSQFLAIVCSVLFAYFTNKIWVFRSRTNNNRELATEFGMFIIARSITMLMELGGFSLLVYVFNFNDYFSKILLTVFVIITNYITSKKAVFNK